MTNQITIRNIFIEDSQAISELVSQLGTSIDKDSVAGQIESIISNPDHFAFVAELNNKVVGYIHYFIALRLTTKPFIEICGLVVDRKERRKGIAKLLINKIDTNSNDIEKIRVRCNTKREDAHKFYYSLGFSLSKEQKIFERTP